MDSDGARQTDRLGKSWQKGVNVRCTVYEYTEKENQRGKLVKWALKWLLKQYVHVQMYMPLSLPLEASELKLPQSC